MTEGGKKLIDGILCIGGSLLLVVGTLLPLWSKDGVQVTGWEGDYFAWGRWLLILAAIGGLSTWAIPAWRKRSLGLGIGGGIGLILAGLVLWQGYKLQAIGLGAWVILGAAVLLLAAWGMRKMEQN